MERVPVGPSGATNGADGGRLSSTPLTELHVLWIPRPVGRASLAPFVRCPLRWRGTNGIVLVAGGKAGGRFCVVFLFRPGSNWRRQTAGHSPAKVAADLSPGLSSDWAACPQRQLKPRAPLDSRVQKHTQGEGGVGGGEGGCASRST